MARRTTVEYQGKKIGGEVLKFETKREDWSVYQTEDGTEVRMKSVVSDIIRLDLYKEDGEPVYLVKSTNLVSTDVPEILRKSAAEAKRAN